MGCHLTSAAFSYWTGDLKNRTVIPRPDSTHDRTVCQFIVKSRETRLSTPWQAKLPVNNTRAARSKHPLTPLPCRADVCRE